MGLHYSRAFGSPQYCSCVQPADGHAFHWGPDRLDSSVSHLEQHIARHHRLLRAVVVFIILHQQTSEAPCLSIFLE